MPSWQRLPHRWGPLTMIAPLSKSHGASRWLARHEVLERLVWVDRMDDGPGSIEPPFDPRTAHAGTANMLAIERCAPAAIDAPSVAMVTEFVPSISVEEALSGASRVWRSERDALASVRGLIEPMRHVLAETRASLDRAALAVDADGHLFVARTINAPSASGDRESIARKTLVALVADLANATGGTLSVSLATEISARPPADLAALDALFSSHFGLDFGRHFASPPATVSVDPSSAPASLEAEPLASAKLARLAVRNTAIDALPAADEVATHVVDAIRARLPLCANRLVLLANVERARDALRELSIRDSSIDPRALALLGPLEPTWIPLHPDMAQQTVVVDGGEVTLCPMQWDELQATASCEGAEVRFCVACARAVRSVVVGGSHRVVAANVCAFNKRRRA
ncbi:MAG: hypothetical protein JNK05_29805 [Myxococcales bacterium]|nr:hypothetical protein [Myxococcales bacterium]